VREQRHPLLAERVVGGDRPLGSAYFGGYPCFGETMVTLCGEMNLD
jgi:hypothetical protein